MELYRERTLRVLVITVGPSEWSSKVESFRLEALVAEVSEIGRAAWQANVDTDSVESRSARSSEDTLDGLAVLEVGLSALLVGGVSLLNILEVLLAEETTVDEQEVVRAGGGAGGGTHSDGSLRTSLLDHSWGNDLTGIGTVDSLASLGGSDEVESAAVDVGLGGVLQLAEEQQHLVGVVSVAQVGVVDLDWRSQSLDQDALVRLHLKNPSVSAVNLGAGASDMVEVVAWWASLQEALLELLIPLVTFLAGLLLAQVSGGVEGVAGWAANLVASSSLGVEDVANLALGRSGDAFVLLGAPDESSWAV